MTENKIITGIREVVFSMREGDQNHLPYLTSVHGHRCLLSVVYLVRDEGVDAVVDLVKDEVVEAV